MTYTVKQVATMSGVSVRTLQYYDSIGLLSPSRQMGNGYREYGETELAKLQCILFFREVEFPLSKIKEMMQSQKFDTSIALADQKKLLLLKSERIQKLIQTIDRTIGSMKGDTDMKNDDRYGSLSKKQIEEYKKEAADRWGNTDAYKQSIEKTKNWTKEDYARIEKTRVEILNGIVLHMDEGIASPPVQEGIKKSYEQMQQFYDCPYEMYGNLGIMYVDDPRFTAFYEKIHPGLAVFMRDAIGYFCDQHKK